MTNPTSPPSAGTPEPTNERARHWSCRIGPMAADRIPDGADWPLRRAVKDAFYAMFGVDAEVTSSGWEDGHPHDFVSVSVPEPRAVSEASREEFQLRCDFLYRNDAECQRLRSEVSFEAARERAFQVAFAEAVAALSSAPQGRGDVSEARMAMDADGLRAALRPAPSAPETPQ